MESSKRDKIVSIRDVSWIVCGEGCVKAREERSYEGIVDMYFTQKTVEFMNAAYAILESSTEPMTSSKKLLKSTGMPVNY